MKTNQAIQLIEDIIEHQKTVSTNRLEEPFQVIMQQLKESNKRNKKLQQKINRQRNVLSGRGE